MGAWLCIFPLFSQTHAHFINGQKIICSAGSPSISKFIPPPKFFGMGQLGRLEQKAIFEVEYQNFPQNAQKSVQYAIDIWASLLKSPVPIRVKAIWDTSLENNQLGGGKATTFQKDFQGAICSETWYATALAEKLAHQEINDTEEFDLEISFNYSVNWYYGTDGKLSTDQYDLVTTALHEIAHGLGIASFSEVKDGKATWGKGTQIPIVYDRFLVDENSSYLLETVSNDSEDFAQKLTNNSLFFASKFTKNQDGNYPKIFAPSAFSLGASLSHLDKETYPIGSKNSLMIPEIAKGVAIHSPGKIILNMLAEMGWVATFLTHEAPQQIEDTNSGFTLKLDIQSDTTFDKNTVMLHYIQANSGQEQTLKMTSGNGKTFTAKIPNNSQITDYQYYFTASDPLRNYRLPNNSEKFTLQIITDDTPPIIEHQVIKTASIGSENIPIFAQVSDVSGISNVEVQYFVNNQIQSFKTMILQNGIYFGEIPITQITENDSIRYRIRAIDNSSNQNKAFFPIDGYAQISIEPDHQVVTTYETNFDNRPDDFIGTGFSINTVSGFSSPAIQSEHPYDPQKEYIYQLKNPIIVKNTRAFMQFDEVVLVEMGSGNAQFGAENFWDYVVIEGSNDNGKTWQFLTPPYDSRANEIWKSEYENLTDDTGVSLAQGNQSLFRRRTINLKNTFQSGEEILIRFRLFSDTDITAWGWAIDNLEIQGEVTGIEENLVSEKTTFQLFPNPTSDKFQLHFKSTKSIKNLHLEIHDFLGKKVLSKSFRVHSQKFQKMIDVSVLKGGIYLVTFLTENGKFYKKIILKH